MQIVFEHGGFVYGDRELIIYVDIYPFAIALTLSNGS
jgi:hypothetical protein